MMTDSATSLLCVQLGGTTVALPAAAVREIVRAVAITPLPSAPRIIEGAVNVRGAVVPVLDLRQRLGIAPRTLDPDEFLVLLVAGTRQFAVRVDDVDDLVSVGESELGTAEAVSPSLRGLAGLAARPDGALVIYDPGAFLTQAEGDALDAALAAS